MDNINLKAVKVSQHVVDDVARQLPQMEVGEPAYVYVGESTDFKQVTINWLFLYTLGAVNAPV